MKKLNITTTYLQETRLLVTTAVAQGFVPNMPDQAVIRQQIDTITLFAGDVISTSDVNFIHASQTKAMLSCCKDVAEWLLAAKMKTRADQLPAVVIVDPGQVAPMPFDPATQLENSTTTV